MDPNESKENHVDAAAEARTLQQTADGVAAAADLSRRAAGQSDYAPKVPGYALEKLLGEGAYGQVWRGVQLRTGKTVAVKVFVQRGGLDWIFLQREVERLTRLDRHPNIVTLLDTDLESEPPSYVMDLIDGGSLAQYVDPSAPALQTQALRWGEQIAQALSYVHGKGLIHCDLKPANVLVDEQDNVRVVDFGQSRVFTESAASLGTLYYMAPEQARLAEPGKPVQPDVRWDVYALGATLHAILMGTPPHASTESRRTLSDASDLQDRLARYRQLVTRDSRRAGFTRRPDRISRELRAVIDKCLAPKPDDRYGATAEVLADLEALKSKRPVSPLAGSRAYRTRKFFQRNPFGVALAAALLVLVPTVFVARQQQSRAAAAQARDILAQFEYAPGEALAATTAASGRLREHLVRWCNECLGSPSSALRVLGALAGPFVDADAFWTSIREGPLWENGEWLELADVPGPQVAGLLDAIAAKVAPNVSPNVSDREKYVAFCLIGQLAPECGTGLQPVIHRLKTGATRPAANASDGDKSSESSQQLIESCTLAVRSEAHPGVVAAARWAAQRLGALVPFAANDRLFVDDVTGMAFARLPGTASYRRGASPRDRAQMPDEAQVEQGVPIAPLYVAVTEVPMSLMERFVNSAASDGLTEWGNPDVPSIRAYLREIFRMMTVADKERFAANWLSLEAARAFCDWLNAEGRGATPPRRYRLPTEAEWEYACRGGNEGRYCFGSDAKYAPYFAACNGTGTTYHVVGERMPNWYGLHDMHGGLWEICDSRYEDRFVTEPEFAGKEFYVRKGGGYYGSAIRCRSTQRDLIEASGEGYYMGVRLVMEIEGQ